jgi:hypothetical protein
MRVDFATPMGNCRCFWDEVDDRKELGELWGFVLAIVIADEEELQRTQ